MSHHTPSIAAAAPPVRRGAVAVCLCGLLLGVMVGRVPMGLAVAQSPVAQSPASQAPASQGSVLPPAVEFVPGALPAPFAAERDRAELLAVEQSPEIYYLPDERGRLVPVPGFRYRDFLDLLRLKEGLPGSPRPPAVVIDDLFVDARLDDTADGTCAVVVRLDLHQTREGWVDLPIRLAGMILTAVPGYAGPGRFTLEGHAPQAAVGAVEVGYTGWLSGGRDDRHTVTLTGRLAVEASAAREAFTIDLPMATSSRVEIHSLRDNPEVSVQPAALPPQVSALESGAGSKIVCEGLGGRTRIRIGARQSGAATNGVLPQVTVETVVRIDGRVALFDAGLRIDEFPRERSTVRVALPPRCTLSRVREPAVLLPPGSSAAPPASAALQGTTGTTDTTAASSAGFTGSDDQTVIDVQVGRRPDGTAVVELECERPVDPTGNSAFEPFGFQLEGVPAWRQRGRTSLVVAGEWQLDWDDPGANRRVDPPPAARLPGFVASFAYEAQPATLPMRIRPRASRVVVEPDYRYSIAATRVGLEAKFRVSVRGAPVSRLVIDLDGWNVDEVGPPGLVDAAAVSPAAGQFVIPFLQPLSGDAVVELRASRGLERGEERLEWSVPAPRADLVGAATVTVAADTDIEILPDNDQIRGLARQVVPAARRGEAERGLLVYRVEGSGGEFSATRRFLLRRVEAVVATQATIDDQETVVEQSIRFDVAHVPMESVDLQVPEEIAATGTLELRQGSQLLNPLPLPKTESASASGDAVVFRSLLAAPLLGSGEVTLRWVTPTPAVEVNSAAVNLPLVMPRQARITRQSFTLVSDDTVTVDVRGDAWKRDSVPVGVTAQRQWVAARPQDSVPLALVSQRGNGTGETVVEATWIETRLFPDRREDVFNYSITTAGRRLSIVLPSAFLPLRDGVPDRASVDVRLDGAPLSGAVGADGRVEIDIPRPAAGTRSASLVRIATSRSRRDEVAWVAGGVIGPLRLESPVFPEGTVQRRFYWELLLADDEHVLVAPVRWTPQQRWEWSTLGMQRDSVVSRGVLNDWLVGSVRTAKPRGGVAADQGRPANAIDPPLAAGRSVFAGTGNPGTGRVWLAPTWLLVLMASGPVLGVGLLMAYRPTWRRTPAVLALLLPAVLAVAAFPLLSPLVIQASLPGVALSLLAGGLRVLTDRTPHADPSGGVEGRVSGSSTRLVISSSLVGSPIPDPQESGTGTGRVLPRSLP